MKQGETFVNIGNNGSRQENPYARKRNGSVFNQGMGTYVPGMHDNPANVNGESPSHSQSTPVVGFLYSISRQGIGEYWPLHLGTNTIGRSSNCDVCLREMSVSEHHATLSIKQMKSTQKLIASIRDVGSKNGMYLNDEELDYDNHSCKSNDIITVGTNYKILLLLIDAQQYGLSVAENFVSVGDEEDYDPNFDFDTHDDSTHNNNPYNPNNRVVDTGTVDLNGAQFNKPGGTKFM